MPMSCPGLLEMPVWLGYGNNSDVHCCLGRVEPSGLGWAGSPLLGGGELLQVQPSLGLKLYLDGAHCLTGIWRSMDFIRLSHKTGAVMVVYSTYGPGRLFFKHLCTFVFSSAEWGLIDPTP